MASTTDPAAIRTKAGARSKISFVSGNFNVLHPGHLRLLKFAAEIGDFLVVGINRDSTAGVTVPGEERLANVLSLSIVNHAVLLDQDANSFIARLKPEIVVKGKEFESRANTEQEAVDSYGGQLQFCSGEMAFSSYSMLDDEYSRPLASTISKPTAYPMRHGFSPADLKSSLDRFNGLEVLVIGDLIIDDYINCDPLGMSQEDPTIVVTPMSTDTFVGGAGVVAAHARGLGANVRFFTVVGEDETAAYAEDSLANIGIEIHCLHDSTRPTTRKQRYRARARRCCASITCASTRSASRSVPLIRHRGASLLDTSTSSCSPISTTAACRNRSSTP